MDGVVRGEGVAGVGAAVVGQQAGGPVHRPQVQPTLHHHISCCFLYHGGRMFYFVIKLKVSTEPRNILKHTALLSFEAFLDFFTH